VVVRDILWSIKKKLQLVFYFYFYFFLLFYNFIFAPFWWHKYKRWVFSLQIKPKTYLVFRRLACFWWPLKETLKIIDYGPLYTTVEKCTGRSRSSAQGMARDGMAEKRKGQLKIYIYLRWVLQRLSFLSQGLRLPKKLDLRRTSLQKKVSPRWQPCHFFIHVQNSPPKDS